MVVSIKVKDAPGANVFPAQLGVPETQAAVPLPQDRPFTAVLVDDDERVLVSGPFLHEDGRGIDVFGSEAAQREFSDIVRTNFANVFALEPHSRYEGHRSGSLSSRELVVVQDLSLGVEPGIVGHYAQMVNRIESETYYVESLPFRKENVECVGRVVQALDFHVAVLVWENLGSCENGHSSSNARTNQP